MYQGIVALGPMRNCTRSFHRSSSASKKPDCAGDVFGFSEGFSDVRPLTRGARCSGPSRLELRTTANSPSQKPDASDERACGHENVQTVLTRTRCTRAEGLKITAEKGENRVPEVTFHDRLQAGVMFNLEDASARDAIVEFQRAFAAVSSSETTVVLRLLKVSQFMPGRIAASPGLACGNAMCSHLRLNAVPMHIYTLTKTETMTAAPTLG